MTAICDPTLFTKIIILVYTYVYNTYVRVYVCVNIRMLVYTYVCV